MSNYKWLLDAGHGGMKNGCYTTAPAKMHTFDDGLVFYEGVNNRAIVSKLMILLTEAGIDHELVFHSSDDTPLVTRVSIANQANFLNNGRCIYLSIHSDAMPEGHHGKGSGFSIFTSKGFTRSDKIASIFCKLYEASFPEFKFRKDFSDGDADKEEDFYVLRATRCPALLVENLFFDNRREAEFLLSEEGRRRIASALLKSILENEKQKPLAGWVAG
jgi:N-acetylmuramoyl-L-alanine amidase